MYQVIGDAPPVGCGQTGCVRWLLPRRAPGLISVRGAVPCSGQMVDVVIGCPGWGCCGRRSLEAGPGRGPGQQASGGSWPRVIGVPGASAMRGRPVTRRGPAPPLRVRAACGSSGGRACGPPVRWPARRCAGPGPRCSSRGGGSDGAAGRRLRIAAAARHRARTGAPRDITPAAQHRRVPRRAPAAGRHDRDGHRDRGSRTGW